MKIYTVLYIAEQLDEVYTEISGVYEDKTSAQNLLKEIYQEKIKEYLAIFGSETPLSHFEEDYAELTSKDFSKTIIIEIEEHDINQ